LEADLVGLAPDERREYLESLGIKSSGVDQLIQSAYRVLGLMSFLTAGEKEVRAWTIPQRSRAQDAAGAIHSDIARGFIRAEIVSYNELIGAGSYATAREQGLLRLEGKDYIMQEGDVVHFRFNV
jgi:ribosome-binding ATPase YchF (GTP1/OBG family)